MALTNVEFRPGDVIITKNGAMADLIGHAAMVIDSGHILNITGWGDTPHEVTISKFIKDSARDGWIKLYRANDYYEGARAAQWLDDTYRNSGASYSLNPDLNSTKSTYCTKMIFQAYYFGNECTQKLESGLIPPCNMIAILERFGFSMAYMGNLAD